jgi:hypothetical protein
MPGKSKRKKMRYASSKQSITAQKPAVTKAASVTAASTSIASKPQTSPVKSSPAASKTAVAQYTPDLLKHVGTELKISIALSASILVVIIGLSFILH